MNTAGRWGCGVVAALIGLCFMTVAIVMLAVTIAGLARGEEGAAVGAVLLVVAGSTAAAWSLVAFRVSGLRVGPSRWREHVIGWLVVLEGIAIAVTNVYPHPPSTIAGFLLAFAVLAGGGLLLALIHAAGTPEPPAASTDS